ncbi:MAG: glycosyltransferase family 2 protein [Phormidesmis sp.]
MQIVPHDRRKPGGDGMKWSIENIDLEQEVHGISAQPGNTGTFVLFWWRNIPLGYQELSADRLPISAVALSSIISRTVASTINHYLEEDFLPPLPRIKGVRQKLEQHYNLETIKKLESPLSSLDRLYSSNSSVDTQSVSVVICTRNRPQQLDECLQSLQHLVDYPAEVLVVDNAPVGNETKAVVKNYPKVKYILELRPGLSIARNTGIRHATVDIIAFTDDDVKVHPHWIERVRYGFQNPNVMVVTGLMLPAELETPSQIAFHDGAYGFEWPCRPILYDVHYFEERKRFGTPVWQIGAGANMALRRQVVDAVGDFNELLGAGASGCSEDSEFWYRVLAAGWTCRYEPSAVVYHYHRGDLVSLKKQQYAYMRGHVVALLIQASQHRHWGNLFRLSVALPIYYVRRFLEGTYNRFQGKYMTVFVEIKGCFAGILFFVRHYAAATKH